MSMMNKMSGLHEYTESLDKNDSPLSVQSSKADTSNEDPKCSQKKHHSGPVSIKYVEASNVRSKTKFIRRKTLFKKVGKLIRLFLLLLLIKICIRICVSFINNLLFKS